MLLPLRGPATRRACGAQGRAGASQENAKGVLQGFVQPTVVSGRLSQSPGYAQRTTVLRKKPRREPTDGRLRPTCHLKA